MPPDPSVPTGLALRHVRWLRPRIATALEGRPRTAPPGFPFLLFPFRDISGRITLQAPHAMLDRDTFKAPGLAPRAVQKMFAAPIAEIATTGDLARLIRDTVGDDTADLRGTVLLDGAGGVLIRDLPPFGAMRGVDGPAASRLTGLLDARLTGHARLDQTARIAAIARMLMACDTPPPLSTESVR